MQGLIAEFLVLSPCGYTSFLLGNEALTMIELDQISDLPGAYFE